MFTVYILFSPNWNNIYIGYTSNFEARLLSHNELSKKGWTIRFRPWVKLHTESYQTKKEALLREKYLKSGKGREWIWSVLLKK